MAFHVDDSFIIIYDTYYQEINKKKDRRIPCFNFKNGMGIGRCKAAYAGK